MWAILVGDPITGLECLGPFDEKVQAQQCGRDGFGETFDWWVIEMHSPGDYGEALLCATCGAKHDCEDCQVARDGILKLTPRKDALPKHMELQLSNL